MMYYTLTIKDKDYKCRLNAKACVDLERRLKTNPLNILAKVANTNELPSIETLITILNASLQSAEHGISMDKTYDLYDAYIEDGHTLVDLLKDVIEIFKVSGFFNEEETEGKN